MIQPRMSQSLLLFFTLTGSSFFASGCVGEEVSELASLGEGVSQATFAGLVRATSPVAGQYIVVLRADALAVHNARVPQVSAELVKAVGGKLMHDYEFALQGFAVGNLNEAQARHLASDPRVDYVQENGLIQLNATQTNPSWGLDRIDQRTRPLSNSYTYNTTGRGVTAFIIDTGIRATHQNFGGRVGMGFTSINDGQGTNDCQGHGTHVAGIVGSSTYGVAKNVTLIPVRVLNCQGSGTDAGVIAGVDWVAANHNGPSVANMSLGGGASPTLDASIRNLVNAGVTTVVAAGNENQNACSASPAREPLAITVGSTTQTDTRSSFSNFGICVDIHAPGSSILSTSNGNDTATSTLSGTSMAAAYVTGVVARIHEWWKCCRPPPPPWPCFTESKLCTPALIEQDLFSMATVNVLPSLPTGTSNRLLHMSPTN